MNLSLCANMLFMTSKSMGTDRSLKSLIPLHCSKGVSVLVFFFSWTKGLDRKPQSGEVSIDLKDSISNCTLECEAGLSH